MKSEQLNSIGLLLARLALGVVLFAHGGQKLLGWFGGYGWSGSMGFMTGTLGIPALFAALAILTEFFGGLLIIAGALTRFIAFATVVEQIVAALVVHLPNGFFMNWTPNMSQAGHGIEMNLAMVGLGLGLFFIGPGAIAIDAKYNIDFVSRLLGVKKHEPTAAR